MKMYSHAKIGSLGYSAVCVLCKFPYNSFTQEYFGLFYKIVFLVFFHKSPGVPYINFEMKIFTKFIMLLK